MDFIIDDFLEELCVHKRDAQSRNKSADVHYTHMFYYLLFIFGNFKKI